MLEVQKYLRDLGDSAIDKLNEELGIVATHHKTLPLVILNYNQLESPKTHPVVRECRGLVLEKDTYNLVARSFSRFFNWGECTDEMKDFDWSDCHATSKEDGSLGILYFYNEEWHFNTKGAFGCDNKLPNGQTWTELFCSAIGAKDMRDIMHRRIFLDNETYVFELASIHNKVVRLYKEPTVYLLTIFDGYKESTMGYTKMIAGCMNECALNVQPPELKVFNSHQEVYDSLLETSIEDPTFEGYVLRDKDNRRWKFKSSTYVALHQMKGGDNLYLPKYQIPFILNNEIDEVLTYFPEMEESIAKNKEIIDNALDELIDLWYNNWTISDQKEFAIKVAKQNFASLLFRIRKEHGDSQTESHLRDAWRNSSDMILKTLFKGK